MSIQLAYGIEVLPHDDPHVILAEKALVGFANAASPGAFLVDILPFLKHVPSFMPGAGFKKQAEIWRQWMLDFMNFPFAVALKEIVSNPSPYPHITTLTSVQEDGVARPSFTSYFLENGDTSKLSPQYVESVKDVAATIFTGTLSVPLTKHPFLTCVCFV